MKALWSSIARVATKLWDYINGFAIRVIRAIPEGTVPLVCWTVLIILGTWYPSTSVLKHFFEGGQLPEGLPKPTGWMDNAAMLGIAVMSWTWTNLAFICLSAAFLGVAARPDIHIDDSRAWGQVLPRAFVVFLACLLQELALGGGLIPSQARLQSGEAQQHYLRLAVLSSIACFAASFRPAYFDGLVDKMIGQLDQDKGNQTKSASFEFNGKSEPLEGETVAGDVAPKFSK